MSNVRNLNDEDDMTNIVEGDGRFVAKELLSDFSEADILSKRLDLTKTDIFSLGMTLFGLMLRDCESLPYNGGAWRFLRSGEINFEVFSNQFSEKLISIVKKMVS